MKEANILFLLSFIFATTTCLAGDTIRYAAGIPPVSFRALSVVNDSVVWTAGTAATVCMSTNGGENFHCINVPGHDSADFRTLYAFDVSTALIANAGSPAVILRTADGGKTWSKVFECDRPEAFINGMDFYDSKRGVCYGDPVDGLLMLVQTTDSGKTWHWLHTSSRPLLAEGEISFAASGTGIRCRDDGNVMISTGGSISRILFSKDFGNSWNSWLTPMIQGREFGGIFSFAFRDSMNGVIVGGDYREQHFKEQHVFVTRDGGLQWHFPSTPTRGYRECVQYLSADTLIAVGPSGVDLSADGGNHWQPYSETTGLHVVQKARKGRLVVVAGNRGQIGILIRESDTPAK